VEQDAKPAQLDPLLAVIVPIRRAFQVIRAHGGVQRLGEDKPLWMAVMTECLEADSSVQAGAEPLWAHGGFHRGEFPGLCHRYFEHATGCPELENASMC
jgi:hypothetical protein